MTVISAQGFKTVSKQQQKKALNFLLNELKDLSWLDARETLKEFPIRTSVAMQMEDAIIDGILSRCGAVAICSGKATSGSLYSERISCRYRTFCMGSYPRRKNLDRNRNAFADELSDEA